MSLFRTALVLCPLALAFGQAPPAANPPPAPKPPAPNMTLSVENPGAPLPSVPPNKVILTVGDEKITAHEFEQIIDSLPEQYRNFARTSGRKQFAENVIRVKLLAKEARRLKIDQDASFKSQLAFQTDNLLAGLAFQQISKTITVEPAATQKYFDEHKSEYERVKARHILIRMKGSPVPVNPGQPDLTEEQALAKAQELRKRIVAGEDFAKLAEAESDDTGSRATGGDLGYFTHGQMVPSFEQAAFALKTGEISEPVKSPFGYHIIKVEGRENKSLDDVKPEIEKRLRPELAQKSLEDLKAKNNVSMDPEFFGEAKPAAPPASPATAKPAAPGAAGK